MKKMYLYIFIAVILTMVSTTNSLINVCIYSLAVVPLAIVLGELTSQISECIGEKKGGLIAAATGNIPELMMGIWSIKYGMLSMVKAALIGSIISNMLLVLGISIFLGGIKYKEQKFNKIVARTNFSMLLLAMSVMVIISSINKYSRILNKEILVSLSIKVAVILMIVYILGLIFSLYTHRNLFVLTTIRKEIPPSSIGGGNNVNKQTLVGVKTSSKVVNNSIEDDALSETMDEGGSISKEARFKSIFLISLSTFILYLISEKLIVNIKEVTKIYNISQEFVGIILIPLLGNVGENASAIICAMKNKVNLSLEIAIGSSIQIALFVTPILIIYSFFKGIQMTYLFNSFQIIMSIIAVGMSFFVFQDGKTYWLEGTILIAIYIIVTFCYYYMA